MKKIFRDTLPVMAGYIVLGIGFGMLFASKGYGLLWSFLMSALVYAGSMQYLAVDLISGGASLIAIGLATLAVNARHLFYGITMIERYRGAGLKKPYMIFSLTDETYSLVCEGKIDHKFFFGVSVLNHIYWVTGCCIGSVIGEFITLKGIDFALTALFVTVFTEQWLSSRDHTAAVCGVISSVLCLLLFGADRFLIPTMIVISISLTLIKKIRGGAVLE